MYNAEPLKNTSHESSNIYTDLGKPKSGAHQLLFILKTYLCLVRYFHNLPYDQSLLLVHFSRALFAVFGHHYSECFHVLFLALSSRCSSIYFYLFIRVLSCTLSRCLSPIPADISPVFSCSQSLYFTSSIAYSNSSPA